MLYRQMRYFTAVVDCNSFTEAAEQCYISQSAISQQIQSLEKELGVQLMLRENRRFSLTPAGEYFYRRSKWLLGEIEEVKRETRRLGSDEELQLRIGFLRTYSGQELHQAVAEFSQTYPEVSIHIVNGTHEEIYGGLRQGELDLVLNDQRRAFSDEYENFQLTKCGCYAELSTRNYLSGQTEVTLQDLREIPCILVASKEQQREEMEFYQNTLGFEGEFLFAETLEEGRLMTAGNRGFLPIEGIGRLSAPVPAIRRIPIMRGGTQMKRNYCVFWKKERTNYYIEEFADILNRLLA